ncbi:redox-sensitive transcriptional activator SoxR [Planotetraspora kaengkrachanensis]|uniref:MerR family transcriptional regulator n=1 Tax=Planotetraspora kaengkrachanensis TaxID=575193 RepID=A0A8J3PRV2_9ACTN|nr:redox-sensitive transcriptional activator SoxR [Planotetraspora kaengkrachanensis]GIG78784.1 MerR family transcriptional regulator [Planotetraspora kaengkrachanensis]
MSPREADELTIGELAERSGVPATALRFYERQGLLRSRRTPGNQRRYGHAAVGKVAFIRASRNAGVPVAMIGEVLGILPEGAAPTREFWIRAARCWSTHLDDRLSRLRRAREVFGGCASCGCLAFDRCALMKAGTGEPAGQGVDDGM